MIVDNEGPSGLLRDYLQTQDAHDTLMYLANAPTLAEIARPHIRGDIFGELYSDFSHSRQQLAEFPMLLRSALRSFRTWCAIRANGSVSSTSIPKRPC